MQGRQGDSINFKMLLRYLVVLVCFTIMPAILQGQSYGLQFSGHEVPLNERTELNLTPEKPIQFGNSLELSFDFRFQPNQLSYFGYVYRMVIGSKSIDFIHGFLPGNTKNFQLVFNDQPSRISYEIPIETLTSEWTEFRFSIDIAENTISCHLGDTVLVDEIEGYDPDEGVRIFFGANEYGNFATTDVARMNIRDIQLNTDNRSYSWPLKQTDGGNVEEVLHNRNGSVKNPNWLITLHTNWKKIASLELNGWTETAFNQEDDLIYVGTSQSLFTLDLTDNSFSNLEFKSPYKFLSSNEILYDTIGDRLISYSIDHNYKSYFDPDIAAWSLFPPDTSRLTTFWHHNNFLHPDGTLYTFGGYGQFYYKNLVLKSRPGESGFDTVNYTGEFYPRYLAAVGYSEDRNRLYMLGGYGSKSGQQTVSPEYYYELLEYNFEDTSFTKFYDCPETVDAFCFANRAVIEDGMLYALAFSKYQFDNQLQLVRINLDEPALENLDIPIDFRFIDVQSDAELYFSRGSDKLIAITSYLDNGVTELNIYSLAFPPQKGVKQSDITGTGDMPVPRVIFIVMIIAIVLLVAWLVWKRSARKSLVPVKEKKVDVREEIAETTDFQVNRRDPVKSSIILFGGFQVIDSEGNDITGSFTQLLKKLLLFIMLNSLKHNKGVSSQVISETFWFDKSTESARNNRAVNIVKIKSLLDKVGVATISKDTGYWKFEYDPKTMQIDYADYLDVVRKDGKQSRNDIMKLLKIIDRGQFLMNTDADWLDVYKSEVSNDIIDTLADYVEENENEPDFVLHLTNCMFMFDIASEEAMVLQCRTLFKLGKHSLAKKSYAKFVKEYKTLYDEEYRRSFNSIIESGKQKDE